MACLETLGISGIRSYDPIELQKIEFVKPITLIHGKNGCGKTTIIECLKYMTTGTLPPMSDRGKHFIMDPKVAKTSEVRGEMFLKFLTPKSRPIIARKILLLSCSEKGYVLKSSEQTIRTKDTDGDITVNQRCADIESQIPQMLGMSKSILQNIVFCHQDDSLWPFSDNVTLKGIFDELLDTRRFTKTMESLKAAAKSFDKQRLILKGKMEYLKSAYEQSVRYKTDAIECRVEVAKASEQLHGVRTELKPILAKIKEFTSEDEKNELYRLKGLKESVIFSQRQTLHRIRTEASKQNMAILKPEELEDQQEVLEQLKSQIQSEVRERDNLQVILCSVKNSETANQKRTEFEAEIQRALNFLPNPLTRQKQSHQIIPILREVISQLKKKQKALRKMEEEHARIVIHNLSGFESSDLSDLERKVYMKDNKVRQLAKKITAGSNALYDPHCLQTGKYSGSGKHAGQKLQALEAQIAMKKSELEKYKSMDPNTKSLAQEVFEMKYAGIELQAQMLSYVKKKKNCLLCRKKLDDRDIIEVQISIEKTIERTKTRIAEIQARGDATRGIDPAPFIADIQRFLKDSERTKNELQAQYKAYEIFERNSEQQRVNQKVKKIMESVGLKLTSPHGANASMTVEELQELANEYRYLANELKSLSSELERARQRASRYQELSREAQKNTKLKNKLQMEIISLKSEVEKLPLMVDMEQRVSELYSWVLKQQRSTLTQDNSSAQLQNQIQATNVRIREMRDKCRQIEVSLEHQRRSEELAAMQAEYNEIIHKLMQMKTESHAQSDMEKQKNKLELEEAKLLEKIRIKKGICGGRVEDPEYLKSLVRLNWVVDMIEDTKASIKAMERAVNQAHSDKMDEINKILFDIWHNVYSGSDIDYIRINASAPRKNGDGFGYSIMMHKNGQLMDMKGRCSMGQKVLASLIIRMALAEAFSASSHILALDEPTTNLDRTHILNLAEAINEIIKRGEKSQLQLIIISHDLEFISMLNKHTNEYYEISRNSKNFSQIQKKDISELQQSDYIRLENFD